MKSTAVFIVLFCSFIDPIFAQRGGVDVGSEATTVYKPNLLSASKLLIDPIIPKNDNQMISVGYKPLSFQWNTRKITRLLPPVGHFEPGFDTSYNGNYVRIGGGTQAHKLLEAYLANRANKQWAYNLAVQHLSADQDKSLRDFSTTRGYLSGARFFKRSSLEMRLSYHRDMNRFFANDTLEQSNRVKTKKIGNTFGANILYDLKGLDRKPGFKVGFRLNDYNNNLNQRENEFGLRGGWDFVFTKFKAFGDLEVSRLQYKQLNIQNTQWFLDLNPKFRYKNEQNGVEATAGLNLTWRFKDTTKTIFYLNPYLYVDKKLEGLKMKVYGGIDGGLRKNSIRRFNENVPFTFDTINILNTYEQLKGYAGLKGRITENSQFSVEFGGTAMSNMPLVVTAADSLRPLQVVYDNVNILYFAGDVRFSIGENWRVSGSGKLNQYTTDKEKKAWHLPNATYALAIQYNLRRKWVFQTGLDGMGKRYSRQIGGDNNIEMKGFADVHLRVDYIVKNTFRLWVQGSNLINQKYQIWYGYTSYRLNIIGGLSASF